MSTTTRSFPFLMVCSLLASSCATLEPTAEVRDDVYFLPSMEPVVASVEPVYTAWDAPPAEQPTEDYYDPNASQQLEVDRSYYDMTYNDPYYYNYGRFGFDASLSGYQAAWNGSGWGMGIGYGYGAGTCWGNGYGSNVGWGGWTNSYSGNWYDPNTTFGSCYNDPYYGGFNGGYGYGNYQSPYGSCYSCYTPVIVGGTSNVVVAHRPSMGSGGGMRTSPGTSRSTLRDPIRLAPNAEDLQRVRVAERTNTGLDRSREQRRNDPYRRTTVEPNAGSPSRGHGTQASERSGGSTRTHDGGGSSPSRSGGDSGGGGTRTSPSHR